MHLPYTQIDAELIDIVAPDMAVMLDWTEEGAGWGLVKLHRWGLARVPDGELPSRHDVVRGPAAARLIARAAGYQGDPEAFVATGEQVCPAVLERVAEGVRIRGLDRYDIVVTSAETRSEKARNAANSRWSNRNATPLPVAPAKHPPSNARASSEHASGIGPAPTGQGAGIAPPMLRDAKTQTQTQIEIEKHHHPEPRADEPDGHAVEPTDDDGRPIDDLFWEFSGDERERRGLARETQQPKMFREFVLAAVQAVGWRAFFRGYCRYLDDGDFHDAGWPMGVYIAPKVWRPRAHDRPDEVWNDGLVTYRRGGRAP